MTSHRVPISVIILTYNEEANIEACLRSVHYWADEIFVVDSGSTDATVSIAHRYTENIVPHPFETHAQQFNWALDNLPVRAEWVMRLDADEMVTPDLACELWQKLPAFPEYVSGLYLKRRVYFMGRWIRHGGYYPTWLLRVFRRGTCRCENLWMDEHMVLLKGRHLQLECDIIDYNRKGLSFWTAKHEGYARREMMDMLGIAQEHNSQTISASPFGTHEQRKRWLKGSVYTRSPLFLRAFAYFLYRYFFCLGFLDGREGLIFHFLQGCWYRFYVDAKIYEARKRNEIHGT